MNSSLEARSCESDITSTTSNATPHNHLEYAPSNTSDTIFPSMEAQRQLSRAVADTNWLKSTILAAMAEEEALPEDVRQTATFERLLKKLVGKIIAASNPIIKVEVLLQLRETIKKIAYHQSKLRSADQITLAQ
jgi:hypothetical protein